MQNEWNDAEDYHNLSGYESNAGNANYCNDNSQPEIFHSEDYFSHHDGSEASRIGESPVGHEPGNRDNFSQSNDDASHNMKFHQIALDSTIIAVMHARMLL